MSFETVHVIRKQLVHKDRASALQSWLDAWVSVPSMDTSSDVVRPGQVSISMEDVGQCSLVCTSDLEHDNAFKGEASYTRHKSNVSYAIKYWDFDGNGQWDLIYDSRTNEHTIFEKGKLFTCGSPSGNSNRGPYTVRGEVGERAMVFDKDHWSEIEPKGQGSR